MAATFHPGAVVEYYSSSMSTWIPARVLRQGQIAGTFDLDCKESVEPSRIRPAVAPATTYSVPATSVPPPTSPCGPLPLNEHDPCYYKSSSLGWISAQMMRFRPEDGTYDLDVKQQVIPKNIFCIQEGGPIEYHSTSSQNWIPARVLRRGKDAHTWDLDCKDLVHLSRMRPPQDAAGGVASPASPSAQTPILSGPAVHPGVLGGASAAPQGGRRGTSPRSARVLAIGGLAPVPEDNQYAAGMGSAEKQMKLDQLKQAINANNPEALKQRLESVSALRLVGEEDLDMAAHNLWALEARPGASADLKKAINKGNVLELEAALEAGAAVGLPAEELDVGRQALRRLESSRIWIYDAGDGHHMDLRKEPRVDGQRVRQRLNCRDYFCVSEERRGPDGITYLELADGRGWAFDKKPGVGTLCTRQVVTEADAPGPYTVIFDRTSVTRTDVVCGDADIIGRLAYGAIVNVLQISDTTAVGIRRIRGRLDNPVGWISLLEVDSGKRWAMKYRGGARG